MTLSFTDKKHWFLQKTQDGMVEYAVVNDGSMVMFDAKDVEDILFKNYPYDAHRKVWFFNSTHDREIAERRYNGRIICNPQVLWRHFQYQTT